MSSLAVTTGPGLQHSFFLYCSLNNTKTSAVDFTGDTKINKYIYINTLVVRFFSYFYVCNKSIISNSRLFVKNIFNPVSTIHSTIICYVHPFARSKYNVRRFKYVCILKILMIVNNVTNFNETLFYTNYINIIYI